MGKNCEKENFLRKWLKNIHFSGDCLCSVDESVVSLLVLAVHCAAPQTPLLIEVPGVALGEKIRNELLQWADCTGFSPEVLLLPDGTSSGRKLMECEIPRAQVLDRVMNDPPDILIASASAELSPAPDPERMRHSELTIRTGMTLAPEKLAELLTRMDYDDEPEVVQKGEFARRGGLIDVFSPAADAPARIEFFGDTVESIRLFSETTQLSTGEISEYKVIMRSGAGEPDDPGTDFSTYVRLYSPRIVTLFPSECEGVLKRFGSDAMQKTWEKLHRDPLWKKAFLLLDEVESAKIQEDRKAVSPVFPSARHILEMIPEGTEENVADLVRQLSSSLIRQLSDEKYRILIAGRTEGDLTALQQWLQDEGLENLSGLECVQLPIPKGIFLPQEKTAVFSEYEL